MSVSGRIHKRAPLVGALVIFGIVRRCRLSSHQSRSVCRFTTRPAPDREHDVRLLGDHNVERGVGQGERAADRQRLVVVIFEPLLDVEVEARQPVILRH
jgi:hypothetical protein